MMPTAICPFRVVRPARANRSPSHLQRWNLSCKMRELVISTAPVVSIFALLSLQPRRAPQFHAIGTFDPVQSQVGHESLKNLL